MWVRQLGRFYLVDVRALYLLVARYEITAFSLSVCVCQYACLLKGKHRIPRYSNKLLLACSNRSAGLA